MQTLEDRLRTWQQELLDLTNRNPLLSFRHSATRPSNLRLNEPDLVSIYESLIQGKGLTILGTVMPDEDDDNDELGESSHASPESRSGHQTGHRLTAAQVRQSRFATDQHFGVQPGLYGLPLPEPAQVQQDPERESVSSDPKELRQPPLPPDSVRSTLSPEKTRQVAHRLHDRARASELEQGINTLYSLFGRLKWRERPGETWRYAPLILLPVRIEERVRDKSYRLTTANDDPDFNQTLTERLRRDFNINLSPEIADDVDITEVLAEVRRAAAVQEGWEVIEDVSIGIVQFHKIRMFTDLSEHANIALQHPIIQALGTDDVTISAPEEAMIDEGDLDRLVAPDQSYAFLDADASQLRAVQMASRGAHLVIHGPPGTGKSQTIANVIAECLANGKSVLFVSEKSAAIEVVYRRLAEHGLDELCLMLHSHKANKRDIIYQIGQRLEPKQYNNATAQEEQAFYRLKSTREKLNRYSEALHQPYGELAASAYWGLSRLAHLADAPILTNSMPIDAASLTYSQLAGWDEHISQVARYEAILQQGEAHPWAWLKPTPLTFSERETLREILAKLSATARSVSQASGLVADSVGLPRPSTLLEARNLQALVALIPRDDRLLRTWFNPAHRDSARQLVQEATENARAASEALNRLSPIYDDTIFNLASVESISAYQSNRLSQFFSRSFKDIRSRVRSAARDGQQRSTEVEVASLRDGLQVNNLRQWFREHQERLVSDLNVPLAALNPPQVEVWSRVSSHLDAAESIYTYFQPESIPPSLLDAICQQGAGEQLHPLLEKLTLELNQIASLLEQLRPYSSSELLLDSAQPLVSAALEDLERWATVRHTQFASLGDWQQSQAAINAARQLGLESTIAELLARNIPAAEWNAAVERQVVTRWLDQVLEASDELRQFSGIEHDALIEQFRRLDRQSLLQTPTRVRRAQQASRGDVATLQGGEINVLRREVQKRRRHMPLRRLFAQIPNLLLRLKPCMMMSPLSVAQFLPADLYHFDVVIFDEASQVRPFDAVGAIIRGSQLIVAGDNRQLPPTTFFDRVNDEVDDDDVGDLRALESILDALIAKNMPSTRLKWHYRSRHEDLIAFSNHHIYERQLVTFPSPTAERSATKGVHLEYVANGSYDGPAGGKVNKIEAHRVVRLVLDHARSRAEQSLGVVALNSNQANEINDQLMEARQSHPELEEFFREDAQEPFFVKPLEMVQGDERDVIIISIGFGKKDPGNPSERLSHNFGPINRDGGERRLNVLVTRARHQVVVVSSIRSGDIDPNRTNSLGPLLLKNYLEFAERGPIALEAHASGGDGDPESPFEEAVGSALERLGFQVNRQVGVSRYRIDLAIVDPERPGDYLLGIECDGLTYHRSKTARDRDRLRQENLENLGWNIHRIWSTDWVRDRDRELNRVVARIADIRVQNASKRERVATTTLLDPPPDIDEPVEDQQELNLETPVESTPRPTVPSFSTATNSDIQPYIVADLGAASDRDLALAPDAELLAAVERCVAIEGPVHWDNVSRRVANAWGRQRVKGSVESRLHSIIEKAVRMGRVKRRGAFLWPVEDREPTPRGRLHDGTTRRIEHISDEELTAGMLIVLSRALSLTAEELVTATRSYFQYGRTGKDIAERLQQVVSAALHRGQIIQQGERFRLPR